MEIAIAQLSTALLPAGIPHGTVWAMEIHGERTAVSWRPASIPSCDHVLANYQCLWATPLVDCHILQLLFFGCFW